MCTRFYIEPESEELHAVLEEARQSRLAQRFLHAGSPVLTSGEIRPTNVVPVIASGRDRRSGVFPMRWGIQLPGGTLVVNARSETASVKPTFRDSWKGHRCIIPASWYYEWEHTKTSAGKPKTGDKYAIQPKGEQTAWLCGLYRMENGFPVFAVVTREPTPYLRTIHDRMPLILPKNRIREWVSPDSRPEELLQYAVTDLIAEKAVQQGDGFR